MTVFVRCAGLYGAMLLGLCAHAAASESTPVEIAPTGRPNQIALDHWPESGWLVQQFGNNVEVRFPGFDRDVARPVNANATSEKIAEIQTELRDADLFVRLTLTCACTVAVTGEAGRRVLIDILDPDAAVPRRAGPAPTVSPLPPRNIARATTDESGTLDVEAARERLLGQLLKAADAGIIDLKPEAEAALDLAVDAAPLMSGESEAVANERAPDGQPTDVAESPIPAVSSETVTVATSDPKAGTAASEKTLAEPDDTAGENPSVTGPPEPVVANYKPREPRCFAPEDLQFPRYATPNEAWSQISALRGRLLGEFDRVDRQVALDLVRWYLALDLADEAKAIIDGLLEDDPTSAAYDEIAAILSGEAPATASALRKEGCSEDQNLWHAQALALDGAATQALDAAADAGRALERLPQRLRERAAASIGLAAAQAGDWDKARAMEAMANRSAGALARRSQELLMLAAALSKWHADDDRQKVLLQKVYAQGGPLGDRALIDLGELALRDTAFLTSGFNGLRADLGGLAARERGTPIGAKAYTLELKMVARNESRDKVLDALDFGVSQGFLPVAERPELLATLLNGDLYRELQTPLAVSYLDDPDRFSGALALTGFRQALATSMIDIGVPTLAVPLLTEDDRRNQELMVQLASALLDTGAPEAAAEIAVSISDGPVRNRLLSEAGSPPDIGNALNRQPLDLPISDKEKAEYRLTAIEQRFRSAMTRSDYDAAMREAELKMAVAPSSESAVQLAMTALQAGRGKTPSAVATYLQETDPDQLRAIDGLFAAETDPAGVRDQAAAKLLVETIDKEISLIEEILGDG